MGATACWLPYLDSASSNLYRSPLIFPGSRNFWGGGPMFLVGISNSLQKKSFMECDILYSVHYSYVPLHSPTEAQNKLNHT